MAQPTYYRDLDLNFASHPVTKDVIQLTNVESVKRALRNLLRFKKYDKPFHPEINSGITDAFFNLISPLHTDQLRTNIINLIRKKEPRVFINDVQVRPNLDGNSVEVTLVFTVKNIQVPQSFTFTLARNR